MLLAASPEREQPKRAKRAKRLDWQPSPQPSPQLILPRPGSLSNEPFGVIEGAYVENYFTGWGNVFNVVSHKHIREGMFEVMEAKHGAMVSLGKGAGFSVPPELVRRSALRSLLWSAVAIGAVMSHQSQEVVGTYVARADAALRDCYDTADEEVVRAFLLLSTICKFHGAPARYCRLIGFADAVAESVAQEKAAKHAEALRLWEANGRRGRAPAPPHLEDSLAFVLECMTLFSHVLNPKKGADERICLMNLEEVSVGSSSSFSDPADDEDEVAALALDLERRASLAPVSLSHADVHELARKQQLQHERRLLRQRLSQAETEQASPGAPAAVRLKQEAEQSYALQQTQGCSVEVAEIVDGGSRTRRLATASRVVGILAQLEARSCVRSDGARAPQVVFVASETRAFELLMGLDLQTLALAKRVARTELSDDPLLAEAARQEAATDAAALRAVALRLANGVYFSHVEKSIGGHKFLDSLLLLELICGEEEACLATAEKGVAWLEKHRGTAQLALPHRDSILTLALVIAVAGDESLYHRLVQLSESELSHRPLTLKLPDAMDKDALRGLAGDECLRFRCVWALLDVLGPRRSSPLPLRKGSGGATSAADKREQEEIEERTALVELGALSALEASNDGFLEELLEPAGRSSGGGLRHVVSSSGDDGGGIGDSGGSDSSSVELELEEEKALADKEMDELFLMAAAEESWDSVEVF